MVLQHDPVTNGVIGNNVFHNIRGGNDLTLHAEIGKASPVVIFNNIFSKPNETVHAALVDGTGCAVISNNLFWVSTKGLCRN